MTFGTHKTRHGPHPKGGPAYKIKVCTVRLHEDVIYCIIPNRIFFWNPTPPEYIRRGRGSLDDISNLIHNQYKITEHRM